MTRQTGQTVAEYGAGAISADRQGADVYRVMVVDDSAVIRGAVARLLEEDPCIRVASSVSNGDLAVRSLRRDAVDVIVLDIEMPVMDGMTALPQLKAIDPAVQIVMSSTLTQRNAEISLRAMSLGATDYVPKPSTNREVMNAEQFRHELVEKVKALGSLARRSGVRLPPAAVASVPPPQSRAAAYGSPAVKVVPPQTSSARFVPQKTEKKDIVLRTHAMVRPDIIAIGSSTGGPQALFKVIKDMGSGLAQPIVITQHMPPAFTTILADHIQRQCQVVCKEAAAGDVLEPGHYYVAPGDFHMVFDGRPGATSVRLVKDPPENFCRPAVDPMLRSLSAIYGAKILVAILTGMGQDGMRGADIIVKGGGTVIAQDEASSVVWGMPGAVAMAGLCSAVMPLGDIGVFLRQSATRARA